MVLEWRPMNQPPKRRWFRPPSYTLKGRGVDHKVVLQWHAATRKVYLVEVDEDGSVSRPSGWPCAVVAECGYMYKFDLITHSNTDGNAEYRDQIKTDKLRCKKCDKVLADKIG